MINLLRFLNITAINPNIPLSIKNKMLMVFITITIIFILVYHIKNNTKGNQ